MQKKYHLTHANVGLIAAAYVSVLSLIIALLFYIEPDSKKPDILFGFLSWILLVFVPYIFLKLNYLLDITCDFLWKKRKTLGIKP